MFTFFLAAIQQSAGIVCYFCVANSPSTNNQPRIIISLHLLFERIKFIVVIDVLAYKCHTIRFIVAERRFYNLSIITQMVYTRRGIIEID